MTDSNNDILSAIGNHKDRIGIIETQVRVLQADVKKLTAVAENLALMVSRLTDIVNATRKGY